MEVSPFLSVSSFYFTNFFIGFLINTNLSKYLRRQSHSFFFFFSPFIWRYASIDYSANEGPRPIVCAD